MRPGSVTGNDRPRLYGHACAARQAKVTSQARGRLASGHAVCLGRAKIAGHRLAMALLFLDSYRLRGFFIA